VNNSKKQKGKQMKVKITKGKQKGKIGRVVGVWVIIREYDVKIGCKYFSIKQKNTAEV